MSKVYILTQEDIDSLREKLNADPKRTHASNTSTPERQQATDEAHRFYKFQIETWIGKVTE